MKDLATLVLLVKYHQAYNGNDGIATNDIDDLINVAKLFEKKYGADKNWEKSNITWEDALIQHYNKLAEKLRWTPITNS